jgi:hypothetical protein
MLLKILDAEGKETDAAELARRYDPSSIEIAPGKKATVTHFVTAENRSKDPVWVLGSERWATREIRETLNNAALVNPELRSLSSKAKDDLVGAISTTESIEQGIKQAAASNPEISSLSRKALEDLRLTLVLSKPHEDREVWIAAITWQSAEAVGSRLALATWGLVAATAMLFLATVALILVTAVHK